MTHRGPFQPATFCDLVIFTDVLKFEYRHSPFRLGLPLSPLIQYYVPVLR